MQSRSALQALANTTAPVGEPSRLRRRRATTVRALSPVKMLSPAASPRSGSNAGACAVCRSVSKPCGVRTGSSVIMTVSPYDPTGNVRDFGGEPRASSREYLRQSIGHEVPSMGAVNNSLTSMNCRTRSATAAGSSRRGSSSSKTSTFLSFCARSIRASCAQSHRREHASHLGNKPRQLPREVAMSGCSTGKIHQLLTDKVVEGRREPKSSLDRLSRLALFDPNLMRFAYIHSRPSSYRRRQTFLMPATRSISTTAVAPKRCEPRWRRPSSGRPARPALAAGDAGVEQVSLQHGVMLRHHRDHHGGVFRALALVDGRRVGRHQCVEFAEAIR